MQAYRKVGVPLYDTLGADSVEYVYECTPFYRAR